MKKVILYSLIFTLVISCERIHRQKLNYPETKKVDAVDTYFGTSVADPYRWLEDDTSKEVAQWVEAQNKVTFAYLDRIPFRNKIQSRLEEIYNYPKYTAPFKRGKYYFFFKNDGLQNQYVFYMMDSLNGEPRVFLDPNKFSEDGTTALTEVRVSHNYKYVGYGIQKAGSDWNEYFVKELSTGKILKDHLKWIKFSNMAWEGDGFYYSRYDEPKKGDELTGKNLSHKVYYHKLGTEQKSDILIYENKKEPQRNYVAQVTEDEHFLIINESESTSGNRLFVRDLTIRLGKSTNRREAPFRLIGEDFKNEFIVIDNIGDKLLIKTNKNAPRWQLVLIAPSNPDEAKWQIIVPEKEEVIRTAKICGRKIVVEYLKDAHSKIEVYELDGKFAYELKLPGIGTVTTFNGNRDDSVAFYSFASFTTPGTIYKYNINTNTSELYYRPEVKFNLDEYETKQIFYESKDGTKIPMFITYKKGLQLNGQNPTLLYGYGGFNASLTPSFNVSNLILLENGGVYAVANIRGGGEYGEEWHKAGMKLNKQNVFDDFIAAAEYLIKEKWTSSEKLAIKGSSNGGLLVGACMTQKPDLFKVVFPDVAVMDMLRYHKFTIGWAWASDYGTSEESKEQFEYLLKYSPVHNVKPGVKYPATMVTTADHDDRVVPAHSFKFIAELQAKNVGDNPVIIRIQKKAGHGAGKPTSKILEEATDMWSFMFYNMGIEVKY